MIPSHFGRLGYEPAAPAVPTRGEAEHRNPDQFTLFKLGDDDTPLLDLTHIVPNVEGNDEQPDVQAEIALMAFHLANDTASDVKERSRATLRLDIGKDQLSNSYLEPLFWSIASGLDLYEHVKAGSNAKSPRNMGDDFSAKFRQHPVEIPGGLGNLRIELVEHAEPPWWRRAIGFAGSDQSVGRIVSSIGFPGIALEAVRLIDEMLGRFDEAGARPILRSRPLTLAFSKAARKDYLLGSSAATIGSIETGFYVLARQEDIALFRHSPPIFLGGTGHLVARADWKRDAAGTIPEDGPYGEITYAVLRIRSRPARLGGF